MIRKNTGSILAQFYTSKEIAFDLISLLDITKYKTIIEPSAGDGSFSLQIPNCIAYDIEPKHESIICQDFLSLSINTTPKETLIIGNPPFGKQSSLAFKFIKKSCILADTVAFILPLSFKKESMQEKIPITHTLVLEKDIPIDSFVFEDKKYSVPCVFQVWKRLDLPREKAIKETTSDFIFSNKNNCDFWFRRVGFYAGTLGKDFIAKSEESHYFIKATISLDTLLERFKKMNWYHNNTVGAKSISKQEIIKQYNRIS